MSEIVVEFAREYPLVFLALIGFGLLLAVILFIAAAKIARVILKVLTFFFSVFIFAALSIISIVAAEHIYAALIYAPPEDTPSSPAYDSPQPKGSGNPQSAP